MSRPAGNDISAAYKRITAEDTPALRRAKDALVDLGPAELKKLRDFANRALPKVCFLLDWLPPEIRVHIYEWALVDHGEHFRLHDMRTIDLGDNYRRLVINRTNFQQPPLLRTSTLIRKEASPIYYDNNMFCIDCRHMNPSVAITFSQHAMGGSKDPYRMDIELDLCLAKADENVMRWLRAHYNNQVVCRPQGDWPECGGQNENAQCFVGLMFENVDTLKKAGVSWWVIEKTTRNAMLGLSWVARL